MAKLNPLHAAALSKHEIMPQDLDTSQGTGKTTRLALQLLAACMKQPGVPIHPNLDDEDITAPGRSNFRRQQEVVERAKWLAQNSGLEHFHIPSSAAQNQLVWEFRMQTPKQPKPDPRMRPGPYPMDADEEGTSFPGPKRI